MKKMIELVDSVYDVLGDFVSTEEWNALYQIAGNGEDPRIAEIVLSLYEVTREPND